MTRGHPEKVRSPESPQSRFRLHRSTYVVVALLVIGLALANVPGQFVFVWTRGLDAYHGFSFSGARTLEHGWPLAYLRRLPGQELVAYDWRALDWWSYWSLTADVECFRPVCLAADAAIALAAVVLGTIGYEWWRRRRRRLLQLHISDFLILALIVSSMMAWLRAEILKYRREQEALAELPDYSLVELEWGGPSWAWRFFPEQVFQVFDRVVAVRLAEEEPEIARQSSLEGVHDAYGVDLAYFRHLRRLKMLDLCQVDPEDEDLAELRDCENLRALFLPTDAWRDGLANSRITNRGIAHLADLRRLEALKLRGERITDDGVAHLGRLRELKTLALESVQVTNEGMAHLADLGRLEALAIWRGDFDDRGLSHLAGLNELEMLDLRGNQITDAGLVHLRALDKLRILRLDGTDVTPAGVIHLQELTNLEGLAIDGQITATELKYLTKMTKLRSLDLRDIREKKATDSEMNCLAGMMGLEELHLDGSDISDAGIVHLKNLSRLGRLSLRQTQITDNGLVHLGGLVGLRWLDLGGTAITGRGLVRLRHLPELESLTLSESAISNDGLRHLEGFTNLSYLALRGTHVSDAGLEHLVAVKGLLWLHLDGTNVTDAGVARLKMLPDLEELCLDNTAVTDAALPHLKALVRLHDLGLSGTKITEQGRKEIEEALPRCDIEYDAPHEPSPQLNNPCP